MIYATVSDELKNRYLRENGIAVVLAVEEKKPETKSCYPELFFKTGYKKYPRKKFDTKKNNIFRFLLG